MRRRTLGLDRVAALVAGLLLVVLGVVAVAWWAGWLAQVWARTPEQLTLQTGTDLLAAPWWPATSVALGVLLGVLALWWLLAHRSARSTGPVRLDGSDDSGELLIVGTPAVAAAADLLAASSAVRVTRGRLVRDRGQLVAEVTATVDPTADLEQVVVDAEAVLADLGQVLGRPDITGRVVLEVARDTRREARVH